MTTVKKESPFLQAFEGKNKTVPVWFMRQAGRYLPEYQAIKKKHTLQEMFQTPEIAAEITLQPIHILGVDAAILFADILTLPTAMGAGIHFDNRKGPVIQKLTPKTLQDIESIPHVTETIRLVNAQLGQTPLIGFAGSPFTVLTYLLEGGSSLTHPQTLAFMQAQEEDYHGLMKQLTKNTVRYVEQQIAAGIDAFQLFDSWAGILPREIYRRMVLPYVAEIFEAVNVPSIYFAKGGGPFLDLLSGLKADILSVDHTVTVGSPELLATEKGVQGNLFNGLLFADFDRLQREVTRILQAASRHKKYIFNLNHGVLPQTDVEKLKFVVECVHQFKWTYE